MLNKISAGKNPPEKIYVVIEIPKGGEVKYEIDKKTEELFVDRFLHTAMFYPLNYGFIPQTLEEDGDPVDVLVLSSGKIAPRAIIPARPIGLLEAEDEAGPDAKVIAVPLSKIDPNFAEVKSVDDLPGALKKKIEHFLEHFKELEEGKWQKVLGWKGPAAAKEKIKTAMENFKSSSQGS